MEVAYTKWPAEKQSKATCFAKLKQWLRGGGKRGFSLESNPHDVLARLGERKLALNIQMLALQHDVEESQQEARQQVDLGYPEVARIHLRQANASRRYVVMKAQQRQNVATLMDAINQALQNCEDAQTMREVAHAQGDLIVQTGDVEALMDELREQMDQIQQDSMVLAEPDPMETHEDVEEELNRLLCHREDEEFAFPTVPQAKPMGEKEAMLN